MLQIVRKIDCNCFRDSDLSSWLDQQFNASLADKDLGEGEKWNRSLELAEWGEGFYKNAPESLGESLFYIRKSTDGYGYQNYVGRTSISYVWPLFFKRFPLGQIWLIKISDEWWDGIWLGEKKLAKEGGLDLDIGLLPQEASGLLVENFVLNTLDLLTYGIYPLILFDYIHTASNLVFLYIPDRALKHSQMTEKRTLNQEILWRLHHVFDDQWTFDGSRGPKSGASEIHLNPVRQFGYLDWFLEQVDKRMTDLIAIPDPLRREQIGMTMNRAICDAVLCVISELPYMSKIFFFACLDKLANFSVMIGADSDETQAWKQLLDVSFLEGTRDVLKAVPDYAGDYLRWIVEHTTEEMRVEKISPLDLRDLRNTHHGYGLRPEIVTRLMQKSGEFNNDITLVVTPLILYFLSQMWK